MSDQDVELAGDPRLRSVSTALTAAALLIALIAVAGHAFGQPALYSLHPGFQAMSLITAIGLACAALAQIVGRRGAPVPAAALGLLGAMLGAAALASHALFGGDVLDAGIATRIGMDPLAVGRTSVSTAAGIAILSLAALPVLDRPNRIVDAVVAFALLIAVLAVSGYAYSSADLYALPFFHTMALNTAVAILLLSCSALSRRPGLGWGIAVSDPGEAGRATRRQLLFLLLPPIMGWLLIQAANAGQLRLGSAMALFVVFTIAPLLFLILHDGRALAALDRERARRAALEGEHVAVLEERLADQAAALREHSQARLLLAEAAARKSEGRYRSLFDSIDAGFCVVAVRFDDAGHAIDYRFLEMNTAFEAHTGLGDAEGQWMRELAPDHEQHWFDIYGEVARTRRSIRFENPAQALDDRWYDVHAFPVDDPALHHVAILFNDVTDRRRAEDALRGLNTTLEQRVADEVAEREQVQAALRQSQKMEAMGQLTGGVAHDFNNLLTPIVGTLDLLAHRGTVTEREKRLLDGALQSAERAKILVQRLLAFARRQPLQMGPVDLGLLIDGMAQLVGSTAGPQVRIVIEAVRDLPPVLADAHQLEMAILNLCVNARDAMPEGGTLTIAAGEATDDEDRLMLGAGRYVRLVVADTGAGMDVETLKRAIEPFYSTKGIGKGTGLGLSMVHGLVGQIGGALDIESSPGIGTRVALWLPVSEDAASAPDVVGRPVDHSPLHGRVLVVDDEAIVRATTADMLQELGYQTVERGNARDAQALLLAGEPFDLVVTDHLMPGMTGAEFALAVRRLRPAMPVLLVSGYADVADVAPDTPRLAKPFRREELRRAIAELRLP